MDDNTKNQSLEIDEVTNLNASDLDVQELENRLELAAATGSETDAVWSCNGQNVEF
jgi:hypothetical protein